MSYIQIYYEPTSVEKAMYEADEAWRAKEAARPFKWTQFILPVILGGVVAPLMILGIFALRCFVIHLFIKKDET